MSTQADRRPARLDAARHIDLERLLPGAANVVLGPGGHLLNHAAPLAPQRPAGIVTVRGSRRLGIGLPAALCLLAIGLLFTSADWRSGVYATALGEQRTLVLEDGSVIALNTGSTIRTDYSTAARTVHLPAGQATFTVAHDPTRPFQVQVRNGIVRALGSRFDVRVRPDRADVAVIEGRIQVTAEGDKRSGMTALPPVSEHLAAGQGLSILDQGQMTPPVPIDVTQVSAWQQRRLVFRGDRLEEIVG